MVNLKGQNNGAELLAFYAALRIAEENNQYQVLRSDSQLLVQYWSKKLSPDKAAKMCPRKVEIIKKTIVLRKKFDVKGGKVEKISGDVNLADLGYHK